MSSKPKFRCYFVVSRDGEMDLYGEGDVGEWYLRRRKEDGEEYDYRLEEECERRRQQDILGPLASDIVPNMQEIPKSRKNKRVDDKGDQECAVVRRPKALSLGVDERCREESAVLFRRIKGWGDGSLWRRGCGRVDFGGWMIYFWTQAID
ncbi:hypothetical protein PRIPAC_90048 [Pristionchus pacificus]|uniref:Uncharacterized protein n=1 Tax=Pristionchus pacificus TaxID=54126 RepID=A0A2A6B7C5_PRIPA|nr:hypothetical protein PRIPAC_90048 [Pristionchus pacificus]|eukprot:PDM61780.1 hypothetical protein PRIPAC_51222 [Pristionchus pacificus]